MLFSAYRYRDAGKEVIDVLWSFGVCIERASIDEAYVDMTAVVNKMLTETESIPKHLTGQSSVS